MLVAGTPKRIALFAEATNTALMSVLEDDTRVPVGNVENKVIEAVVLPDSPYAGRLIGSMDLNSQFGVKIMGLQHNGRQQVTGLRESASGPRRRPAAPGCDRRSSRQPAIGASCCWWKA